MTSQPTATATATDQGDLYTTSTSPLSETQRRKLLDKIRQGEVYLPAYHMHPDVSAQVVRKYHNNEISDRQLEEQVLNNSNHNDNSETRGHDIHAHHTDTMRQAVDLPIKPSNQSESQLEPHVDYS